MRQLFVFPRSPYTIEMDSKTYDYSRLDDPSFLYYLIVPNKVSPRDVIRTAAKRTSATHPTHALILGTTHRLRLDASQESPSESSDT